MHQHDFDANLMQDRDLLDQYPGGPVVGEHGAARLDDENLAFVHANVGRRAFQGAHGDRGIRSILEHRNHSAAGTVDASMRCRTAMCTTNRLKASRLTTARGPSSTSSATATLRRTGRQCMSLASGNAPAN